MAPGTASPLYLPFVYVVATRWRMVFWLLQFYLYDGFTFRYTSSAASYSSCSCNRLPHQPYHSPRRFKLRFWTKRTLDTKHPLELSTNNLAMYMDDPTSRPATREWRWQQIETEEIIEAICAKFMRKAQMDAGCNSYARVSCWQGSGRLYCYPQINTL